MKKLLSLILAAAFLAGCGGYQPPAEKTAPPETETTETETTETEPETTEEPETQEETSEDTSSLQNSAVVEFPASGFIVTLPESFVSNLKGELRDTTDGGESEYGSGLVTASWDYLLRSQEESAEFYKWLEETRDQEFTDDDRDKVETYFGKTIPIMQIIGINRGRGMDEIKKALYSSRPEIIEEAVEIGQYDGFTYYFIKYNLSYPVLAQKVEDVSQEVIDDFIAARDELAANPDWFTFTKLVPNFVPPEIGSKVSFSGTDLNGSEISSETLFSEHEITVINIWRTWCDSCIDEFPKLQQIREDFADQGVAIVTYCANADGEELTSEAKGIVDQYGFDVNLAKSDVVYQALPFNATPYTYFVSKDGSMLTYPIVGADPARVRDYIERLLKGEKINEPTDNKKPEGSKSYVVRVNDQNGDPVKGAVVSFCSDVSCDVANSDKNGIAAYSGPAYAYNVHFVQLPDGYKAEEGLSVTLDEDGGSAVLEVVKE